MFIHFCLKKIVREVNVNLIIKQSLHIHVQFNYVLNRFVFCHQIDAVIFVFELFLIVIQSNVYVIVSTHAGFPTTYICKYQIRFLRLSS